MPPWDIFEYQTRERRGSVLPPHVTACLAVEQALSGRVGAHHRCEDTFGAPAALKELQQKFHFKLPRTTESAKELVGKARPDPVSEGLDGFSAATI